MRFFLVPFAFLSAYWAVSYLLNPCETVMWFLLGIMFAHAYCIGSSHGRDAEYKRCSDIVKFHVDKIQTIIDEKSSNNQTVKE